MLLMLTTRRIAALAVLGLASGRHRPNAQLRQIARRRHKFSDSQLERRSHGTFGPERGIRGADYRDQQPCRSSGEKFVVAHQQALNAGLKVPSCR
jgi:hypothetical protein